MEEGPGALAGAAGVAAPSPWRDRIEVPALSVVIPTLDEVDALPALLADLAAVPVPLEVLVADGGSADGTVPAAHAAGATVVRAPPGRGTQLRAGCAAATARVLAVLHADVRLPAAAREALAACATLPDGEARAFAFRLPPTRLAYRVVTVGTNLRARWWRLPYGDQGLVLTAADLARAGGYDDIPLLEDVALVHRLRRIAHLRLLDAPVDVSPRRWERDGVWRRTLRNWRTYRRWRAGVPPAVLAAEYARR
jgi:rSAM/selenodomain-associated transferase 2